MPFSCKRTAPLNTKAMELASMATAHPILILPPQKYLRECFTYNERTNVLRWRNRPRHHFRTVNRWHGWNTTYAGTFVGTRRPDGYSNINISKWGYYYRHRIIWKLVCGREPPPFLDHIDGNRSNDRISNLRPATRTQQKWNSKVHKNNTSGYRGISKRFNRYTARIGPAGNKHLGTFRTLKEAIAVYEAAARKLHGKFYRGRS